MSRTVRGRPRARRPSQRLMPQSGRASKPSITVTNSWANPAYEERRSVWAPVSSSFSLWSFNPIVLDQPIVAEQNWLLHSGETWWQLLFHVPSILFLFQALGCCCTLDGRSHKQSCFYTSVALCPAHPVMTTVFLVLTHTGWILRKAKPLYSLISSLSWENTWKYSLKAGCIRVH